LDKVEKTYHNIFDYSDFFAQKNDSLFCRKAIFNVDNKGEYYPSAELLNSPSISHSDMRHDGIKRFNSLEQVDGIFVSLLLCFMLLVHIYRKGLSFFKENIQVAFSSRDNINMFSESTVGEFWYNLLLVLQTVFLFSLVLFVYFFETRADLVPPDNAFITIVSFIVVFMIIEGGKYLFYRYVGYLFNMQQSVNIWLRAYTIIVEMIGILSFIPVLLLVYFDYYHNILFVFFILLFILSRLIIIYRLGLFFLQKNVNPLYLIAYLCSVEIIPYILLYNGMIYLYENEIIKLSWL